MVIEEKHNIFFFLVKMLKPLDIFFIMKLYARASILAKAIYM